MSVAVHAVQKVKKVNKTKRQLKMEQRTASNVILLEKFHFQHIHRHFLCQLPALQVLPHLPPVLVISISQDCHRENQFITQGKERKLSLYLKLINFL